MHMVQFLQKKNKINFKTISYKNIKKAEIQILKHLKKNKIKFIFLAGFMKILSKNFIKKFKNKIINIHPSLLPKYKGLNTYKRAINNREKFSGFKTSNGFKIGPIAAELGQFEIFADITNPVHPPVQN